MKKKENILKFRDVKIEKSDALMLFIVFSFLICVIYFNPRLLALLVGEEPFSAKLAVVIFVLMLNMMWLYGIYHFGHILFSCFTKTKIDKLHLNDDFQPAVAILYTTLNDFNEKACQTCLHQDYSNFKLFICDDSTDEAIKAQIGTFYRMNRDKVEILRRLDKKGFKAGNINYALSQIDKKYDYIAVMDSDTRLDADYLKKSLLYFQLSSKIAYVQAKQKSLVEQKSGFASILKTIIDVHWKYYMRLKNRFGFVMWYGHGAVLRRSIIEEVGGIPEVITEDLAFSSEARRLGYYGIVADDIETGEETPETLEKYRKRNRKWVRGTYQYLLRIYPKVLFSKNIPWFEKADIFISAFSLLQAFPFLLLVYVASFIMPYYYVTSQLQGPVFLVPPAIYDSWVQVLFKTKYNVFWVLDFYLIMFVVIFFPLLPAIVELWKTKKKMFTYIAMSTFIHISILLDSAKEVILYSLTSKAQFHATNNSKSKNDSRIFLIAEFAIGLYLIFYAVLTYNIWLIALGIAFILNPFIIFLGYRKPISTLIPLPFAITTGIMFFIGITIIQNMF